MINRKLLRASLIVDTAHIRCQRKWESLTQCSHAISGILRKRLKRRPSLIHYDFCPRLWVFIWGMQARFSNYFLHCYLIWHLYRLCWMHTFRICILFIEYGLFVFFLSPSDNLSACLPHIHGWNYFLFYLIYVHTKIRILLNYYCVLVRTLRILTSFWFTEKSSLCDDLFVRIQLVALLDWLQMDVLVYQSVLLGVKIKLVTGVRQLLCPSGPLQELLFAIWITV